MTCPMHTAIFIPTSNLLTCIDPALDVVEEGIGVRVEEGGRGGGGEINER